jgi:lipoprotein NlpI
LLHLSAPPPEIQKTDDSSPVINPQLADGLILITPFHHEFAQFLVLDLSVAKGLEAVKARWSEQMLQFRAERPEQRGQVHLTGGVLRQTQGKWKEAESEYLLAYEECKQSGKATDADAAAALNYLGALYITEERFKEAFRVLDHALAIVAVAEDAL